MSFLSQKGSVCVCVCVCVRVESVCVFSLNRSIPFSQNLKKSNRVLK